MPIVFKPNEKVRRHFQRLVTISYFGGSAYGHRGHISFGQSDLQGWFSQSMVAKWVSERSRKALDLISIYPHTLCRERHIDPSAKPLSKVAWMGSSRRMEGRSMIIFRLSISISMPSGGRAIMPDWRRRRNFMQMPGRGYWIIFDGSPPPERAMVKAQCLIKKARSQIIPFSHRTRAIPISGECGRSYRSSLHGVI